MKKVLIVLAILWVLGISGAVFAYIYKAADTSPSSSSGITAR